MPVLKNHTKRIPTRKVGAGGLGGSASVLMIWLLNNVMGLDIPPQVSAAIGGLAVFVTSYFVRDSA